ncbi:class I SAM-dependent methyltransferase [Mycobacterium sp. 1245805.9]|uniref:class I SAM-dependent methyltransferase n=1 Tax=Mycobacterium sp. 1245805.9 TaxID=1856862 RepID=UPI000A73A3E1|nr:class I SAM-dependent methyltransferase [Mycobacterium sp. 1245805.9]
MAGQPAPERDYLLGHSRPEIDRLIRQAEMLRPITERLLVSAGIERGMRVLDIGCGPGDVSLMLAGLVGPTGNVFGIDPSEDAIAVARQRCRARRHTNAEFIQSDIQSYEGPADFDAAVCRYVLIHQKDPGDFLRMTRRLVRTGGVIALHEMDATRGIRSNPRLAVLHEVYDAVHYTLTRGGAPFDVGGRLVRVFREAGLPAPSMFTETLVESAADSQLLPWMVGLAREVLPHMVAAGAMTAEKLAIDTLLDRLWRQANSSDCQLEFVPQMCAWVRV